MSKYAAFYGEIWLFDFMADNLSDALIKARQKDKDTTRVQLVAAER
jgi:hypothetical protein